MGTLFLFLVVIIIFALFLVLSIFGSLISSVFRLLGFGRQSGFSSGSDSDDDDSAEVPEGSVGYSKKGRKRLKNLRDEAEDVDFVEEK